MGWRCTGIYQVRRGDYMYDDVILGATGVRTNCVCRGVEVQEKKERCRVSDLSVILRCIVLLALSTPSTSFMLQ